MLSSPPFLFIAAAIVAGTCPVASSLGQNLISNGDFSGGPSGFGTDYVLATNNTTEGQYTVSAAPGSFNPAFQQPAAASLMMVVNGATTPGLRVWFQTVAVTPGLTYRLALRAHTAVAGGPAILQFSVNGSAVGAPLTLPNSPATGWVTLEVLWTADTAIAHVVVDNLNTTRFPNDFYMDDLSMVGSCGTQDFNGDGDFGTDQDIEAFFACLAGSCCATCCPCGQDFNADGDFGTDQDIESFFRVLAGGAC